MDTNTLLRELFSSAHRLLETTVAGLSDEQAHASPGGTANSIAANLAHIVFSEDRILSTIAGTPTVYESQGFYERVGAVIPDGPFITEEWARGLRVELASFMDYAQAVFTSTDEILARMTDTALGNEVSLSGSGPGMPVASVLGRIALYHVAFHTGEISAIKGTQNLKGIPF